MKTEKIGKSLKQKFFIFNNVYKKNIGQYYSGKICLLSFKFYSFFGTGEEVGLVALPKKKVG